MTSFNFTDEQLATLRRAVNHELNDNSYCQSQAQSYELRERLKAERKTLHELADILNRRQAPSVDEVADNAVSK